MASRTVKFDTSDLSLIAEMGQMYLNEHNNSPGVSKQIEGIIRKCKNNAKTIKISSRKGKGRGLQQWVCARISYLTGFPYDNQSDDSLILSRPMGQIGLDIILKEKVRSVFPFSIECKNSESLDLIGTIAQVQNNKLPDTQWMIVHKRKTLEEPIIIMTWEALEGLYKRIIWKE